MSDQASHKCSCLSFYCWGSRHLVVTVPCGQDSGRHFIQGIRKVELFDYALYPALVCLTDLGFTYVLAERRWRVFITSATIFFCQLNLPPTGHFSIHHNQKLSFTRRTLTRPSANLPTLPLLSSSHGNLLVTQVCAQSWVFQSGVKVELY